MARPRLHHSPVGWEQDRVWAALGGTFHQEVKKVWRSWGNGAFAREEERSEGEGSVLCLHVHTCICVCVRMRTHVYVSLRVYMCVMHVYMHVCGVG